MFVRLAHCFVRYPRVTALLLTVLAGLGLLGLAIFSARPVLRKFAHQVASLPLPQKNQGVILARSAFATPGILPLYGSSELTRYEQNRPSEFFAAAPTGFQVCPIGMAGNTTLLMAMKLASVGEAVHGHPIAVLLSPGWFAIPTTTAEHYAGNFSRLQAIESLENPALPVALKQRLAQRMLDYRATLENQGALLRRTRTLAGEEHPGTVLTAMSDALLAVDRRILESEDALQASVRCWAAGPRKRWRAQPAGIAWEQRLAAAAAKVVPSKRPVTLWKKALPSPMDALKREEFASAERGEWADLTLLLDTIQALEIPALIIGMPLAGAAQSLEGVLPETRHETYYQRLEDLCKARGVAVQTMENHDLDPDFLVDYVSHPTAVGWLHIDHVLDDFWHQHFPTK